MAPADVVVYGPRKFVQPDVFVVPLVNDAPMRAWTDVGRLLLTAEVLSPSTERTDRGRKRILYKEKAVPEYWIVDTDERIVERWRPDDYRSTPLAKIVQSIDVYDARKCVERKRRHRRYGSYGLGPVPSQCGI